MKHLKAYSALLLVTALLFAISAGLVGCGSTKDDEFGGFQGDAGYHPFEDAMDHGTWLADNSYDYTSCTECHGSNLRGVDQGLADRQRDCTRCHGESHGPNDWSEDNHAAQLRAMNWDMDGCYVCHRTTVEVEAGMVNFGGGDNQCTECHTSANGPNACTTCHGDFDGDVNVVENWAPPAGLYGESETTDLAVGAHQIHMDAGTSFNEVGCQSCHMLPGNIPGHIDESPAEVVFGGISDQGGLEPMWDRTNQTCSSTYCHKNDSPVWTEVGDGTWNACGSCHGVPPVDAGGELIPPHWDGMTLLNCYTCHGSVISDLGQITSPSLHVNGVVNGN